MMPAFPLRVTALGAVGVLLVTGLVSIEQAAAPPVAAAPLPASAQTFDVSQSAQGDASNVFLTADAQRAVYTSTASDLVPGDDNGVSDVFLSTTAPGQANPFATAAVLVSAPDGPLGPVRANGPSDDAVATADGRYVAFTSRATNLTAEASTPGRMHVYVRDTVANRTIRIQGAEEPNASSSLPDLSDDGRRLVLTTDADNLLAPGADANGAYDSYVVQLDANADGTIGDFAFMKVLPDHQVAGGTHDAVISGNGYVVGFVTRASSSDWLTPGTETLHAVTLLPDVLAPGNVRQWVGENVTGRPSVDAVGKVFGYLQMGACEQEKVVVATHIGSSGAGKYSIAVGTDGVDLTHGLVDHPTVSADGTHMAWMTTQPAWKSGQGPAPTSALPEPIVRVEEIMWRDATGSLQLECHGLSPRSFVDVPGPAQRPSLSASGRSIAFDGGTRIRAVDRHNHGGLVVSSTQGYLQPPTFMTEVPIASIPLSSLRGYAAAIADAPIHRLPIHRLPIHRLPIHRLPIHRLLVEDAPIHRLPIHRLPIHRLPIHRLDLPGGWAQVLEGTPFAGELLHTVTLDAVLAWAAANPGTDAAARIRSLTLDDVGLDGTGLESLGLASYALGSASVADLPLPGAGAPPTDREVNLERWRERARAQGLVVEITQETVLADLDAAGLDIAASGIEQLSLSGLSAEVIDATLLGLLVIDPALLAGTPLGEMDVQSLDTPALLAVFGDTLVTGTLAAPSLPLKPTATFGDLAKGAVSLTLGSVLFALLDASSYPWEQIEAASIDPRLASDAVAIGCVGGERCTANTPFRYSFDVGPGEATEFAAPTATLTLATGTVPNQLFVSGTGPGVSLNFYDEYAGPRAIDGGRITLPLPDTRAGTVLEVDAWGSVASHVGSPQATATLTSGSQSASDVLYGSLPLALWDESERNWSPEGGWQVPDPERTVISPDKLYYEWISPAWLDTDDNTGEPVQGPAGDEDFYLVAPPQPGQRLVVSTNAQDGQVALSLFSADAASVDGATLGLESAGPVPGTPVTEQSGASGEPAMSGADAGAVIEGRVLLDQAVQRGTGSAEVEVASTETATSEPLLVRVTSGNGQPSAALYSLRVQYLDGPAPTVCAPWSAPRPDEPAQIGTSDVVTDATNTVFLVDTLRFSQTHGSAEAEAVRAALTSLTGEGVVGDSTVQAAVLSVDASPAVRSARTALDANPCSMPAREALTSAINRYVADQLGAARDGIRSIVIVGGDDIIPFAPVAQQTSRFTEASHAAALRLTGPGCDAAVAPGTLDPCATPLSAAAAASQILTDDPYALAQAYRSLGGHLYVPTTAIGRLVETPEQIRDTVTRFIDADGVLAADDTLTGGYGAWSELPDEVTSKLAWRSTGDTKLGAGAAGGLWNRSDVEGALFADDGAPSIVSINTHADEKRMLPGVQGAPKGAFTDADLFETDGVTPERSEAISGSLLFLIGCHAGNNLPSAYYGDTAVDWVDVFSSAGGYVGNTGYGLANSVTTALGERLLSLYSDWLGVTVGNAPLSTAESLMYAKQAYLGGLGLYSGYDEKALMGAVYYGLPMYTLGEAAAEKSAPVPEIPSTLTEVVEGDGLSTASLTFSPDFQKRTAPGENGADVSYLVADGQEPAVVAGQPVLPKLVAQLRTATGLTPRGAIITQLTSTIEGGVTPAIAEPGLGTGETASNRVDAAFPSSFATIARQETPDGPVDTLVVTPGRVVAPQGGASGTGSFERFTSLGIDVVYGDADETDTTPPSITSVSVTPRFTFDADGTGSALAQAVVLVQYEGETEWTPYELELDANGGWAPLDPDDERPYRWILQVVDAAGNVAVDSNRGRVGVFRAATPELGPAGGAATVSVGDALRRTIAIEDGTPGEQLTARVRLDATATPAGSVPQGGGTIASVVTGQDGTLRAVIDQRMTTPGSYTATLTVCRGDACTDASFAVEVPLPNEPPTASVALSSDTPTVGPLSVLTAEATGTDPEGEDVFLEYAWTRNGTRIAGADGRTLALASIGAARGDTIGVIVTPHDGVQWGHAASASAQLPPAPRAPQITATATNADGEYLAGSWSRSPVTVTFACTGVTAVQCPPAQTVSADTTEAGLAVSGTATDVFGGSATIGMLVRVDRTAPTLAPVVSPNPVAQGASATVAVNAADAASGLASATCAVPQTAVAGPSTVSCEATDVAGNRATRAAAYTVQAPAARLCKGVLDRTALAPINADGSSVYLRTSGVPVSFRACDAAGKPIGTKSFVTSVTLVSTSSLPASAKINELWTPPLTGFAYLKSAELWLGQISTVKLSGGKKYTYKAQLADGSSFTFTFGVR